MTDQAGRGGRLGPLQAEVMAMLWRASRPMPVREVAEAVNAGRSSPLACRACIDSPSVDESAEGVVPAASSGFDPLKKVNGRKRRILIDTVGFPITVAVTPASVLDRDPAFALLTAARRRGRHRLARIWADNATATGSPQPATTTASPSRSSPAPTA